MESELQQMRKEKQKRLGPAPFASFEDTSDEMESIASSSMENRLPEIREHQTPTRPTEISTAATTIASATSTSYASTTLTAAITTTTTTTTTTTAIQSTLGVLTPSTPRIDISRASSSSHHDSRDSSPDNVFDQVGTGTLQEGLGFREDGTIDLRSSTEELYFMEPEKGKGEREKATANQQARRSPVIFKFDEHQAQACLLQNQRKDSASSEVAALLCISGRTSRISSVGSQGSAVSRLSAVSGISRSPSPHRMLLETSFCGPKPVDNVTHGGVASSIEPPTADALEQVLLARKHDPTQAVIAEGINIDTAHCERVDKVSNGRLERRRIDEANRKIIDKKLKEVAAAEKATGGKKVVVGGVVSKKEMATKPVVGKTPSGVEYIRIKLKPDHLYDDKGMAPNERALEQSVASETLKKPVTLSLSHDTKEQRLTPTASPKPSRHAILARDAGSRSPSPATVTISRKSSFCSLFKSKEAIASPESPIVAAGIGQRKKSSISTLLTDSPRDRSRSRSKSRDRDRTPSVSGTPSKQKSVLAIFKPKRSGSKSKSSSPIEPEISSLDGLSQVEFKFNTETSGTESRPRSRLRYYDTPLDGKSIHIPLHTPPEEKDDLKFVPQKITAPIEGVVSIEKISDNAVVVESKIEAVKPIVSVPREPPPVPPPKVRQSPQSQKQFRIENLEIAARPPMRSPSDENEITSTWSMEVHRNSSQDSQETVPSSKAPSNDSSLSRSRKTSRPTLSENESTPQIENGVPPGMSPQSSAAPALPTPPVVTPGPPPPTPTPPAANAKEKRRILFCTKIGSGSEEQIFSTQLSISKTESLSSQLSEQVSLDSPAMDKEVLQRSDTVIRRDDSAVVVVMRKKESSDEKRTKSDSSKDGSEGSIGSSGVQKLVKEEFHRHSRYIENIDEIMAKQRILEETRRQMQLKSIGKVESIEAAPPSRDSDSPVSQSKKPEPVLEIPGPPIDRTSMVSTDDPGGSSGSDRDSEADASRLKRHLPRHLGTVEDHESAGLVSQDSFEDELPYVPTTLPEERSVCVALIPMKERALMEVKTCPVERPRSTTPMNPAFLEEYSKTTTVTASTVQTSCVEEGSTESALRRGEKLRISLPRRNSKERMQRVKSPRRPSNASGKSWFEFAEQGQGLTGTSPGTAAPPDVRRNSKDDEELPPPPLPPRKPQSQTQWINFENIPEKRKPPKRITTLPLKDSPALEKAGHLQYNYVNPDECQCECHEMERCGSTRSTPVDQPEAHEEETVPLLEPEASEAGEGASSTGDTDSIREHQDNLVDQNRSKPFGMDLSVGGLPGSNRSSVVSQEPQSPELDSPNDSVLGSQKPAHRNP